MTTRCRRRKASARSLRNSPKCSSPATSGKDSGRDHSRWPAALTYREQSFFQYGLPRETRFYGPPLNAPLIGIRGFPGGFTTGSANLHEFSTVPAIEGGYDVWEAFTEFNLPLWESESGNQRAEVDVAGSPLRLLDERRNRCRTRRASTCRSLPVRALSGPLMSRDVREATFAERFNLQGGGGAGCSTRCCRSGSPQVADHFVTSGGNPLLLKSRGS